MNRRRFIATLAAASTLTAGCVDSGGDGPGGGNGTDGGPGTDGGTGTPTPPDAGSGDGGTESPPDDGTDDLDLSVDSFALQHGLVVPETPDSIAVEGGDSRYLWVEVTVNEHAPPLDDLSLEVHPDTYEPLTTDDFRAYRTEWSSDSYYDGTRGTHLVLFELPVTVDAPRIEFQSPAGHVRAPDRVAERLGRDPPSMSASLVKRYDETPNQPVAVEVTNEGDVQGRFLAAINRQGPRIAYAPVARLSFPLDPGETRTIPIDDSIERRTATPDAGEPDMTYHLRTLHGDDEAVFGER